MSIKDKMRLAPKIPLQKSLTRMKLYNSEWINSLGVYSTQCVIRGKTHSLDFGIVQTDQKPLLSGETWANRSHMLHHSQGAGQGGALQAWTTDPGVSCHHVPCVHRYNVLLGTFEWCLRQQVKQSLMAMKKKDTQPQLLNPQTGSAI